MRFAIALAVVVVVLVATAAPVAATAKLQVTARAPFTVHGAGFAGGERVTIEAHISGRHVKVVTAGADGTFTVRFAVSLGACPSYRVTATGSRGSRAAVSLIIRECAPPGSSP